MTTLRHSSLALESIEKLPMTVISISDRHAPIIILLIVGRCGICVPNIILPATVATISTTVSICIVLVVSLVLVSSSLTTPSTLVVVVGGQPFRRSTATSRRSLFDHGVHPAIIVVNISLSITIRAV